MIEYTKNYQVVNFYLVGFESTSTSMIQFDGRLAYHNREWRAIHDYGKYCSSKTAEELS